MAQGFDIPIPIGQGDRLDCPGSSCEVDQSGDRQDRRGGGEDQPAGFHLVVADDDEIDKIAAA
jgi:hypothetical protein